MTRHSALRGPVSVAMMVGVLLLVSSCSSSSTSSPSTSTTSPASTQPTGSLKVAVDFHNGAMLATNGKAFATGNTFQALGAPAFDSLVEPSPDGKPRPGLAERWEISKDGKTHTFYLRKGVKFHDGSDLTAADVKFSFDAMIVPDATGDGAVWRAAVASVDAKDDYTIVMNFKQPQFELLVGFENYSGADAVVPKKYVEEKGWDYWAKNPIGSGPFKVVKFEPNTRLELEAVLQPKDWRAMPKFKSVTILSVKEEASKVAMLKTGELDIATISPDSAAGLKAAGLRVLGHYGGGQVFTWPLYDVENPDKYAFGDKRVRKAMSLAVDRKELGDKMYGGYAQPGYLMFTPRTGYFFDANQMKPDPYDPEGAKKLMAEAGYANGFSTTAWDAGGGSDISTLTQALVGYWRKVGINADLVAGDRTALLSKINPKMLPDAYNKIWSYSSGGGIFNFERFFTPCHPTKGTPKNLKNPQLAELIDKVPTISDPAERKKVAQQAVLMCKDEFSTLTFLDVDTLYAVGSQVGQLTPTQGMLGLGYSYENVTHSK